MSSIDQQVQSVTDTIPVVPHIKTSRVTVDSAEVEDSTTFRTLAMCNVDEISLVQQSMAWELHDSITDRCLTYPEEATSIVHEAESYLLKRDKHPTLIEACKHQSLKHIVTLISGYGCGTRLWTVAMQAQ